MRDSLLSGTGIPDSVYQGMVDLRRDLHRHPELSLEEVRTADAIAARLKSLGIECKTGIAGTGVVAEIPGQNKGPVIALRADTDALPIQEETGLEFTSVNEGVMHACGHDGHTSMVMGAAQLLSSGQKPPLPVRLIFQPAEELGAGAKAMMEAGVLENVGMIFGGHLDRRYPAGVLIVTEGPVNASTDTFTIRITGQQGHGARPHEALDAVVVGSLLVMALQTIVSREVDPAHPSVLSIGSFHAGAAPNVIAGSAELNGTIRALEQQVRQSLIRSVERIAQSVGQLHGAKIEAEFFGGTPPVINSPEMADLARRAAVSIVGPDQVEPLRTANMGGEDFAYYLEKVPGCYIRFGGQIAGLEGFPAHSSRFDFDERALATGAAWFDKVARMAGEQLIR